MITRSDRAGRMFSTAVILLGAAVLTAGLVTWQTSPTIRFGMYLVLAVLAAGLKSGKPAFPGTISIGYVFLLLGIIEFTLPETLLIGCATVVVQWLADRNRHTTAREALFELANVCVAVATAHAVFWYSWTPSSQASPMVPMVVSALALFAMNTFPAAVHRALMDGSRIIEAWHKCSFWTLPFYLSGAVVALLVSGINRTVGWDYGTASLPLVLLLYRMAKRYVDGVQHQEAYLDDLEARHYRVIETLGVAIEARKHSTDVQLKRTETYALGIGQELGLRGERLRALRVAALLGDIGILSVPEQITSKPGRLTTEEYEKVKSNAEVGAGILERVKFPFPVVPAVRHQHERWDGTGYPDGLERTAIPIEARILAVASCFSALVVSRPYRKALARKDALNFIISQAGVGFDPDAVVVLMDHHEEFEERLRTRPSDDGSDFAASIIQARQEAQELFELAQELGRSLCLNETLFNFIHRIRRLVDFDCAAAYMVKEDKLVPEYVAGVECPVYYGLEIPLGDGIAGRVVATGQPVLNEDPRVEVVHASETHRDTAMRSAVVVPLPGDKQSVGAIALYRLERNAFTKDELRILLDASRKLAQSVQNALQYQTAADSATTDSLTGLANARSLFHHLDSELARCRRTGAEVSVLVCDLDGFKHVNDRFGHLVGNNVLQAVAGVLQANCREYDFVARMGGDEFVMLLPEVPAKVAREKARSLTDAVTLAAEEACTGCGVSMSVGTAHFPDDGSDAEALLAHGDREMYGAKEHRKVSNVSRGYDFDMAKAAAR
ncbi:MAG: diguanylate cyclase [bacterium]|nr:diguanylate cyclase [bacterium]